MGSYTKPTVLSKKNKNKNKNKNKTKKNPSLKVSCMHPRGVCAMRSFPPFLLFTQDDAREAESSFVFFSLFFFFFSNCLFSFNSSFFFIVYFVVFFFFVQTMWVRCSRPFASPSLFFISPSPQYRCALKYCDVGAIRGGRGSTTFHTHINQAKCEKL